LMQSDIVQKTYVGKGHTVREPQVKEVLYTDFQQDASRGKGRD